MPPPVASSHGELRQKALHRIRISPRQSITLAKDGSLSDMQALIDNDYGHSRLIPTALRPAIFEMFCSHVRNTDLRASSRSGKDTNERLDLVVMSLHGLSRFEAPFMQQNPESVCLFRYAWPSTLIWLQRIEEPEKWGIQPSVRLSLPRLLGATLTTATTCGGMNDLYEADKFIDFVTRMWLRDDWNEEDGSQVSGWLLYLLPDDQTYELPNALAHMGEVVGRAISRANVRASQAFVASLSRLRSVSNSQHITGILAELSLIEQFIAHNSKLKSSFIRARGLDEVIRALQRIHSTFKFSTSDLPSKEAFLKCFSIIVEVLESPRKAPFLVKKSIEQGLLKLMLRGRNEGWFEPNESGINDLLYILSKLYPSFCSIPSIAHRASKAVKEAMESSRVTFINIEESRFKAPWVEFNLLLAENMLLKALLTQRRNRLKCDNPDCSIVGNKRMFHACASCKETIYCSVRCQRTAWKKHGHKELCKAHRVQSNSIIRNNSDRSFIKGLAIVEISRHIKYLYNFFMEKELAMGYENADLSELGLGFRVDFVQFPPNISLIYTPYDYCSGQDVSDQSEVEYRSDHRKLVFNGDHRGGVFIEIRVPTGGRKYDTLMCMGDVEKFSVEIRPLAERPGQAAVVLRRGQSAGGIIRRVCTGPRGPLEDPLEAEYDEVDELLRRLKLASVQTSSHLLDEQLIDSVVERYMEDVQDSTLGLYS